MPKPKKQEMIDAVNAALAPMLQAAFEHGQAAQRAADAQVELQVAGEEAMEKIHAFASIFNTPPLKEQN